MKTGPKKSHNKKCVKCKSDNVKKNGPITTKVKIGERYRCQNNKCKHSWTVFNS